MKNTPKTLPAYAPKTPLLVGASYENNIRAYGPAPKGWRWRKIGETDADGDILADGSSLGWRTIRGNSTVKTAYWPIATPVTFNVKRDPKGRFSSTKLASPAKVELGEKFIIRHGRYPKSGCEASASAIGQVLADPVKNRRSLMFSFSWSDTPHGHSYWADRYDGKTPLSPSDLDYLRAAKEFFEKRVAELTPPAPKPPTVAELQAKIASLESENASLRRKIAGAKSALRD